MNKLVVGFDIDETGNVIVDPLLQLYNKKYNDNIKFNDITNYGVENFIKPECQNIFKEFADNEFLENLDIQPHAVELLNFINDNCDLRFVTASHPVSVLAKHNWLKKYFKFYEPNQLIICPDKHLVKMDILIDDCWGNLKDFDGVGILISRPWNEKYDIKELKDGYRVKDLSEVKEIIKKYI